DGNPDIFESLTPEPLGDISDENSYRKKLDKNICTRGGLSLETLRIGNSNEIENSLMQIKKNYSGYKHIISGTCETLYGTPLGNINILSKIAERLEIRFS
ncbi:MAG: hypothetical protein M1308_22320, partial [Actinobacteria bacterium]|nr:hypothetical protein [Actinomycetota bacterium]